MYSNFVHNRPWAIVICVQVLLNPWSQIDFPVALVNHHQSLFVYSYYMYYYIYIQLWPIYRGHLGILLYIINKPHLVEKNVNFVSLDLANKNCTSTES